MQADIENLHCQESNHGKLLDLKNLEFFNCTSLKTGGSPEFFRRKVVSRGKPSAGETEDRPMEDEIPKKRIFQLAIPTRIS